jgi:hypothetical protein
MPSAGRAVQIAVSATTSSLYYRQRNSSGDFLAWKPLMGLLSSGSSANGSWRTMSDGHTVCESTISFAAAISQAYQGLFRTTTRTWTFPVVFTAAPNVQITSATGTAFGAVLITTGSTETVDYAVVSGASQSSATRVVHIRAEGTRA